MDIKNRILCKLKTYKKNDWILFSLVLFIAAIAAIHLLLPRNITGEYTQNAVAASKITNYKRPIYCVDTQEKKLSISFDVAWGNEDIEEILKILDNHNVTASFFLCGHWLDRYPEEAVKIQNAGHDIGNHGDTHAHGNELDLEGNKKEIKDAHDKIKALLGVESNLFRAPYGEYNNLVLEAAESLGYYTIQWDIDSLDWKEYGDEALVSEVLTHQHLGSGSIILFHNDTSYTASALENIIIGLKDKGYDLVPISDLIYRDNYYIDHEGRQFLDSTYNS